MNAKLASRVKKKEKFAIYQLLVTFFNFMHWCPLLSTFGPFS